MSSYSVSAMSASAWRTHYQTVRSNSSPLPPPLPSPPTFPFTFLQQQSLTKPTLRYATPRHSSTTLSRLCSHAVILVARRAVNARARRAHRRRRASPSPRIAHDRNAYRVDRRARQPRRGRSGARAATATSIGCLPPLISGKLRASSYIEDIILSLFHPHERVEPISHANARRCTHRHLG